MAAPSFANLYEEINNRVENFYTHGSILVDNKYMVGLYGSYVEKAVKKMRQSSSDKKYERFEGRQNMGTYPVGMSDRNGNPINLDQPSIPPNTYERMEKRWENNFLTVNDGKPDEVELRWTVSNVSIPNVKPTTDTTFSLDSMKNLWYPIITGLQKTDMVTLTIVEERGMGMYQFFNALMNEFFFTQALKPKSSFHKVAMYIAIINGEYIPTGKKNNKDIYAIIDIPLHIFEFNSIVLKSISNLTFKADSPSKVTFTVTFEAPNSFQGSYASTTMKGLMDATTDKNFTNTAIDKDEILTKLGEYKHDKFTIAPANIKGQLVADTSVKEPNANLKKVKTSGKKPSSNRQ